MSYRVVLSWLVAVVWAVSGCAGGSRGARGELTRIEGSVHGHDGRVPTLAHVRVIDAATDAADETEVGKDGSFVLKTRRSGLVWLELTAVDHAQLRVPIVLSGAPIGVQAQLGTYRPGDPKAPVQLMAWAGEPGASEPIVAELHAQPNGTLVADVPTRARKLRVQLGNVAGGGRGINPARASAYEYDGGGDYLGVLPAKDGKVHVELRAGERPTGVAPKLVISPPDSTAAQLAALGPLWPSEPTSTPTDPTPLWARAHATNDATVRRLATAMALTLDRRSDDALAADERALAKTLVESTPFGDSLWGLMPAGVARAADLSGDPEHAKLVDRVLAEQLGPEAGGMVLLGQLAAAHERGDEARAGVLFAKLSREPYAGFGLAEMATAWKPGRKVARGQTLPRFEGNALEAKSTKVGSDALRGKLVLIELWATWCDPCVQGMGELHAVHEEFAGAREGGAPFEILSISMDEAPADVTKFRERWPMPWLHVFAGEDREKLYATFETATLPYSVLVDEQGTILEESAALEPGKLRGWLAKHTAKAAEPASEPVEAPPVQTE